MFNQFRPSIHRHAASVRLSDIINDVPVAQMSGPLDAEVAGISTDSRLIQDRWLFAAVEGGEVDGHAFVQQAVERGASVVVVQLRQYEAQLKRLLTAAYAQHNATTVVVVEDSRIAVAILADRFYGSPAGRLTLVGITGTNGKTTTSYLIQSVLEAAGEKTGLIGTIEYHIGKTVIPAQFTTPPAEELHRVLRDMVDAGCTAVVMEVSSHALALRRVYGMLFDVTVFTNLTQDHLDFHHTMENYAAAKALLFSDHTRSTGVFNIDDPASGRIKEALRRKRLSYGRSPRAAVRIETVDSSVRGLNMKLRYRGAETAVRSALLGEFNAYNIAGAFGAGLALGIDERTILKGIRRVKSVPGRFERIQSRDGVTAVVDYSHTPDSLAKAISTARGIAGGTGRVITVFGCGGDRDHGKRPLMGNVAASLSDIAVVTSDNPRNEDPDMIIADILSGVSPDAEVYRKTNRKRAIDFALRKAQAGDIVLIAGKGHETYQLSKGTRRQFDDREVARECLTRHHGGVKV